MSEKKPSFFATCRSVFTAVVVAVCIGISVFILGILLMGSPVSSVPASESVRLGLAAKYNRFITNEVSDALKGIVTIPKEYWLNDADRVAPKPNPECFGQAKTVAELQWLLDEAAPLLDGQTTLFNAETPVKPDTVVNYYLDETIFAVTWKQVVNGGAYTFSEIKVAHPSQFRRFLAGGEYGSGALYTTTEMSQSVNAVVAASGDYYSYRPYGTTVLDGITYRANDTTLDICFVDENGDLLFVHKGTLPNKEDVERFVEENNVRFSLAFGPIMIEEGELCVPPVYVTGEISKKLARAALCQLGPLHYVVVTVNLEPYSVNMPSVKLFAQSLLDLGIPNAYSLDGGQTASIVMNNELINSVSYGDQREISDIIYFATALPEGG